MDLPKSYNPKNTEDKIYKFWEKSGFFNPDKLPARHKKAYSIVIPPPNITGELHIGHALNLVIQDILIRWKRMQGFRTLWLPGTDHAGIATQNVVEKKLKKQGRTRFDLGREKFIKEVWKWKEKYGDIILNQFKKLGSSCDWSRTRFTMDKNYAKAVETAFLNYYKKGWIYQGKRVINWCSRCATSLSDLELEYKEEKGRLYYIRYNLKFQNSPKESLWLPAGQAKLAEGVPLSAEPYGTGKTTTQNSKLNNKFIVVATTRPETMLGDTAVAVNPKDKRYKNLVGQKIILPLVGREIPIIADKLVDQRFGTGAVKVTPAHNLTDYQIGRNHKLEIIQVIDEKGKITRQAPTRYQKLKVSEARKKIVEDLKRQGFLKKIEDYNHQIPKCYRCDTIVELIPSLQWFLKMNKLAKMAIEPVKKGKIKFHPQRFEKSYFDWLKNVRDWCISRQLWWGHKIPIKGEDDVLDTWFSAALWPFATMNWPSKNSKDLKEFYPTDVLSTGRDIINLWVSRMIFSSLEFMKEIPFKDVFIHATVLTREGKRMSKSLGTGVDPIKMIEQYGADAARFGIAYQIMENQDIRFVEDNIIMGKKFCNKIWNGSRFVLQQIPNSKLKTFQRKAFGFLRGRQNWPKEFRFQRNPTGQAKPQLKTQNLTSADKRILSQLNKTMKSVNKDLENFKFGKSAHTLYDFFWHDFCDIYLEKSKKQIDSDDKKQTEQTKNILVYVLLNSLILLHPFVPFITEEIYQKLPIKNKKKSLMIESWPG